MSTTATTGHPNAEVLKYRTISKTYMAVTKISYVSAISRSQNVIPGVTATDNFCSDNFLKIK